MEMHESMPSSFPPNFSVDEKQMPEIKKWKVGGKYRLVIDVEQKSMREDIKDMARADFDVLAYQIIKTSKKPYAKMSDKEIEAEEAKALAS